jgi:hypothetical protein
MSAVALAIGSLLAAVPSQVNAQQPAAVTIGNTDIGGAVSGFGCRPCLGAS